MSMTWPFIQGQEHVSSEAALATGKTSRLLTGAGSEAGDTVP